MNLVVHVGYHKTGSTAIQELLNLNRDVFSSKGFVYPRSLSTWPGHPELSWVFHREAWPWQDRIFNPEEVKSYYRNILDRFVGSDSMVIISSEEFCRLEFDHGAITSFHEFIRPYNPIILGYVRHPLTFLLSRYRHEVQNGAESRSLREFLCAYENLQTAAFGYRAQKWNQVFDGRCIFRDYDAAMKKHGTVITDFFETIGCSLNSVSIDDPDSEIKLHPLLLEARRLVNSRVQSEEDQGRISDALFTLGKQLPAVPLGEIAANISPDLMDILNSMQPDWIDMNRTIASVNAETR